MRRYAGPMGVLALTVGFLACGGGSGGGHHGPPPQSTQTELYVESCAVARTNGWAPIHEGRAGYRGDLDPNHNGIACEAGE